jgi:hypothetical protein
MFCARCLVLQFVQRETDFYLGDGAVSRVAEAGAECLFDEADDKARPVPFAIGGCAQAHSG